MCCGGSSSSTPQPRPYKRAAERQAEYDAQRKKRTWYNNPTPEMEEAKVKAFQREFRRLRLEAEARGEMKPLYPNKHYPNKREWDRPKKTQQV